MRLLAKRPAFAALVIGTLALGIGVNSAMFSLVRAVLLRPLGYDDPDRLVKIAGFDNRTGLDANLSPADFMDFARDARSFERLGAHGWVGFFTIGGQEPERLGGVNVTEGFFPALGVQPALGRVFSAAEDAPGAAPTAVLSDGLWRRKFAGDPSVVGSHILVNEIPTLVVGVLPSGFEHVEPNPDRAADIFVPYRFATANPNRGGHFIRAVGRLKPDASVQSSQSEVTALASTLEFQYPRDNTGRGVRVELLHASIVRHTRQALLLLLATVGVVLLVYGWFLISSPSVRGSWASAWRSGRGGGIFSP
jgi:hypothetical protein